MKTSIAILLTALALTSPLAHADHDRPGRGFAAFLQVVAEAARQGSAAHHAARAQQQEDAYYEADAYYEGEYAGSGDYGPVIYELSGDWVLGNDVNRFQKTHQGYYVIPVGRGNGVHYVEIGDNLYQDANGSGTYEVVDEYYMIWRSNDRRNLAIELFRR